MLSSFYFILLHIKDIPLINHLYNKEEIHLSFWDKLLSFFFTILKDQDIPIFINAMYV